MIKTAQGNRSLGWDFRPPSSGRTDKPGVEQWEGLEYRLTVEGVRRTLDQNRRSKTKRIIKPWPANVDEVCSEEDGSKLAEYVRSAPVNWDGMAAASRRLYLTTADGRLVCMPSIDE
ncbi:MAG: hypothetical protein ACYTG0_26015 [Planctomycetota bacterium]